MYLCVLNAYKRKEINEKEIRGALIDVYGKITYVKNKAVSNLSQSVFTEEDELNIIERIREEEVKNIEEGEY